MTDEWAAWRQELDESAGEMRADNARRAQEVMSVKGEQVADRGTTHEAEMDERMIHGDPDAGTDEVTAVVVAQPQQHLVVGVGALAAMSEADFARNLAMLEQGQKRLEMITDKLLVKTVDYGHVPGVKKPFLLKPGAEKLANFYGLAVSFEAERVEGHRAVQRVGDVATATGEYEAPPLAYHVKALVHLRDFDGPVVAQGYGEANSWEERYRYRESKRVCPTCSHEGLIKGRPDGKLKGKWWCAGHAGGCNKTFEAADPAITDQVVGKVDNPDPYGLANTLVKMAEKRAMVDGILRATGTSGFFTQDEDSPSVRQQSGDSGDDGDRDDNPPVENVTGKQQVERGGKPTGPTPQQIAQLTKLSKEKDLGPDKIAEVITRVFDVPLVLPDGTRGEKGKALLAYIQQGLTADQFGRLLHSIDTGEVPA